jgi:hypothetical protein
MKIQQHCKTACFIVYVRSAASELTRSGHTKSDRFPDTKDAFSETRCFIERDYTRRAGNTLL